MSGLLGLRFLARLPKVSTARWISTSKKQSDVSATATVEKAAEACEIREKRNWQSYGFSDTDEKEDLTRMHQHGFFFISIGLCLSIFIMAYRPEINLADWSHREAFLELRRREKLGLPRVDPNYVDPATVVLPTDEELGDMDIII